MENKIQPYLLYCPQCLSKEQGVSLGSITSQGFVILKRKFAHETMIMADSFTLVCDCGYYIRIEYGKIIRDSLHQYFSNG